VVYCVVEAVLLDVVIGVVEVDLVVGRVRVSSRHVIVCLKILN